MTEDLTLHEGREKAKDGRTDRELQGRGRAAGRTRHPDSQPVQKYGAIRNPPLWHTHAHPHTAGALPVSRGWRPRGSTHA